MIVKTRIFKLCYRDYRNLSELAQAMEISVSQVYRVREGTRHINQKFIVGAIKAFPGCNLDDLFYLVPESLTVNNHRHQHSTAHSADETATKEKQGVASARQTLKRFASATEEYGQHLKSHTSAVTSLKEASQEMRRGAEAANKMLSYLRSSCNLTSTEKAPKSCLVEFSKSPFQKQKPPPSFLW